MNTRKAWAVVTAFFMFLSWLCTAILDVPAAVGKMEVYGPEWINDSRFQWAIGFLMVQLLILRVVWVNFPGADGNIPLEEVTRIIERFRFSGQMMGEFGDILKIVTTRQLTPVESKFYSDYLSTVMPAKIECAGEYGDREKYFEVLNNARRETDNVQLHYRAVTPFLEKHYFKIAATKKIEIAL